MYTSKRAQQSYSQVNVITGVACANNVQLIQMLFDGLVENLAAARGHIQQGVIAPKARCLDRASRIVVGLQGSLDFEHGGELARHLDELYAYLLRRLIHINARNDLQALEEILGLTREIRDAWQTVPSLAPAAPRQTAYAC